MQRLQSTRPLGAFPQLHRLHFFSPQNQALVATYLAHLRARHYAASTPRTSACRGNVWLVVLPRPMFPSSAWPAAATAA
jgi:hypothetical protein